MFSRKPTIYTPHGFSFIGPTGANCRKLTFILEVLLSYLPGKIVCCSRSELEFAKLLTKRASFIDNFIELEEVIQVDTEKSFSSCDVVNVGRISHQKNAEHFMETARLMPHLKFVWIGGPLDALKTSPPSNVEVTGWVERSEVLQRLKKAKIFLLTSRYEGMPIALMKLCLWGACG